ncbi:MAG: hypothetical protein KIT36_14555 [Alphaproteobacteria bacterium]|nr:hypothetical protein [Alphaproteobacteria bacterium]
MRIAPLCAAAALALLQTGAAIAQPASLDRSSEMLDAMIRRMKLCAEITDAAARLACYDRIEAGEAPVPAAGSPAAPATTAAPRPVSAPPGALPPPAAPMPDPAKVGKDDKPVPPEDKAFDPRAQGRGGPGSTVGAAPGVILPGQGTGTVAPPWRRIGAVPMRSVPGSRVPVVTLELPGLRPGADYRWQLSMVLANNTPRTFDVTIACAFRNGDRPVSDLTVILRGVRGGEKVAAEISGPPTHQFVDNAPCHVVSPLQ